MRFSRKMLLGGWLDAWLGMKVEEEEDNDEDCIGNRAKGLKSSFGCWEKDGEGDGMPDHGHDGSSTIKSLSLPAVAMADKEPVLESTMDKMGKSSLLWVLGTML